MPRPSTAALRFVRRHVYTGPARTAVAHEVNAVRPRSSTAERHPETRGPVDDSRLHAPQSAVLDAAIRLLEEPAGPAADGGSVKIQKENGRFQEERTYPGSKDPVASKG